MRATQRYVKMRRKKVETRSRRWLSIVQIGFQKINNKLGGFQFGEATLFVYLLKG